MPLRGGAWSSTNTAVATVRHLRCGDVPPGTTTISIQQRMAAGTVAATMVVTVNPLSAGTISGTAAVCAGSSTALTDATTGGAWSNY